MDKARWLTAACSGIAFAATMAGAQEIRPEHREQARPVEQAPERVQPEQLPRPAPTTAVKGPSILAIFAHPDDEITVAPALARAARYGSEITLIFATSGDAGPGESGLEPGTELAALREDEARCAAFALGLPEPVFWKLGDGTLGDTPRAQENPARRAQALAAQAIASMNPKVLMTWGPDGGYGHGDHRMVSAVVTEAVQQISGQRPDLIYSAIPSDAVNANADPGAPILEGWATMDPSLITDRLSYDEEDLAAVGAAIQCYESQFSAAVRDALPQLLHERVWRGKVHFRLAFPPR